MRPEPLNILVGIILQPGDQGTRTKKVDPEGTQGPRGRQTSAGTKQGQVHRATDMIRDQSSTKGNGQRKTQTARSSG